MKFIKHTKNDWIEEAIEFSEKYNLRINLTFYDNRCGRNLLIEMCSKDDEKSVTNTRMNGISIEFDNPKSIYHLLYDRLPSTRRRKNMLRRHFKCH